MAETAVSSLREPSTTSARSRLLVVFVAVALVSAALEVPGSRARADVQPMPEGIAVLGPPAYDEQVVAQLRGYHDDGTLDGGQVVDVLVEAGVFNYQPGVTLMHQPWDRVPDVVLKALDRAEESPHRSPPETPSRPQLPAQPQTPQPQHPARPEPSWSWPLSAGVISSEFGRRGSRPHEGMDIAARRGEPIYAASAGTVIYAGSRMRGYGNALILHHGGSTTSLYAHSTKLMVRNGDRVERGSPIATVGATGRATGPHLHFEIRVGSRPIDPRQLLPRSSF